MVNTVVSVTHTSEFVGIDTRNSILLGEYRPLGIWCKEADSAGAYQYCDSNNEEGTDGRNKLGRLAECCNEKQNSMSDSRRGCGEVSKNEFLDLLVSWGRAGIC